MTLDTARKLILLALEKMRTAYRRPVFDEWILVRLDGPETAFLAYDGPRAEGFAARFHEDMISLRSASQLAKAEPGAFEFSRNAVGTGYDAYIMAGPGVVLLFNATSKTIAEITADPLWLAAQQPFVQLALKFESDPLGPAR